MSENYVLRFVLEQGEEVRQFNIFDCEDLLDAIGAVEEIGLPSPLECAEWGIANFDGSEFAIACG